MIKIVTSSSARGLTEKINDMINEGWEMIGGHQVVVKHSQNRFAGNQHRDTTNDLEYSCTMRNKLKAFIEKLD